MDKIKDGNFYHLYSVVAMKGGTLLVKTHPRLKWASQGYYYLNKTLIN